MRKATIALVLLVFAFAPAVSAQGGTDEDLSRFREAMGKALEDLRLRAGELALIRSGFFEFTTEEKETAQSNYESARAMFFRAARENWPFAVTEQTGAMDGEAADALSRVSERRATVYPQNHTEKIRDELVAEFVAVAEKYPESRSADQALIDAAVLYTQYLPPNVQRDPNSAASIWRRLIAKSNPVSPQHVLARDQVTGYMQTAEARARARSDLYLDLGKSWEADQLASDVLRPTPGRAPNIWASMASGYVRNVPVTRYDLITNMVASAANSKDPLATLKLLEQRHQGDKIVQAMIVHARKWIVKHKFDTNVREELEKPIFSKDLLELDQAVTDVPVVSLAEPNAPPVVAEARPQEAGDDQGGSIVVPAIVVGAVLLVALAVVQFLRTRKGASGQVGAR